MKLRVAIVDDEPLARERLRSLLPEDVEVVCECEDGISAAKALREQVLDAAFLDVRMPGMDGFQVVEEVGLEKLPWIVFLTAHDEHAVRAFEKRAIDYLLKPSTRARVREAVDRIRERVTSGEGALDRRVAVRDGSSVSFVRLGEIEWVEAAGNYAVLHTVSGVTHILRETMTALEEELSARLFLRVSRGAIVNIARVVELRTDPACVVMKSGVQVTATRSTREIRARLEGGA